MNVRDFRTMARELRVLTPPVWPVRVRRMELPEDSQGDCALLTPKGKPPYYIIRVSAALSEEAQVHVLLHEWAHALSWGSDSHRVGNHGPEWGIAMSRIWQAVLEN
jgi:hypothetical protein